MNHGDLLDLANDLCDDDREVAWRDAVSRAYYAAFHAARLLLERAGFVVPRADRAHGYLWLRLQNCGHPDLQNEGAVLKELREQRNVADYDLSVAWTHHRALMLVRKATHATELFDLARESPETLARITAVMRDYERDVLKDVTWRGDAP